VRLDLVDRGRLRDPRALVELAGVPPQVGVVHDAAPAEAEVRVVDDVEAQERDPRSPIRLGQRVAGEIAALAEDVLQARERREDAVERLVVGLL
jgi:hypothetical protein